MAKIDNMLSAVLNLLQAFGGLACSSAVTKSWLYPSGAEKVASLS